jgi:hypothetical protein
MFGLVKCKSEKGNTKMNKKDNYLIDYDEVKEITIKKIVSKEIPEDLFIILKENPMAFGNANLINKQKASGMDLWEIKKGNIVLGYTWLKVKKNQVFISVGIIKEYRNKGYAKKALIKMESIVKEKGFDNIFAQSNSNSGYGLFVRKMLLKLGYLISDKKSNYIQMLDEQYITKYPSPITFVKILAKC